MKVVLQYAFGIGMRVKKVTIEDIETTYCCIPESSSWAGFLPETREWFKANLGKYVEGCHLLDGGKVVGFIYYTYSENALVPYEIEPKVAVVHCTELLSDYLNKGYGKMMFDCMKDDLKKQGFKGIIVVASDFKEWMHYELFVKQGFQVIAESAPFKVLYFPLNQKSTTVKVLALNYKPSKDKVEVTLFRNSFCPVGVSMYYLIKKVAQSFGDKIRVVEIEATPETVRKYGTAEPLFNGKVKLYGPANEEAVRKAIQEEIDQFQH